MRRPIPKRAAASRSASPPRKEKGSFDFTGTYSEVKPPERIVIMIDDGRPVTVEFKEQTGKTLVTLTLTLETTHSEEQQRHGWGAMLENLNTYLERKAA